MEFLAVILLWLVALAAMLKLSAWVLGPLELRAKRGERRLQFTLGDWVCLILLIQAWAAIAHSVFVFAVGTTENVFFADAYGWVLVVILWLGAVWRLTAAGIRNVWHRAAAIVFVYPLVVLGSIVVPFLLGTILANYFEPLGDGLPVIVSAICVLAVLLILGGMLGAGQLVRKIVAATKSDSCPEEATGSGEDS